MLVVETIAKIRRAHFVQGKPIKQICRELKLSRKVVRKVLRSEETAFEYKRSVQPQPKLGAWRDELDRLLGGECRAEQPGAGDAARGSARTSAVSATRAATTPSGDTLPSGDGREARGRRRRSCR